MLAFQVSGSIQAEKGRIARGKFTPDRIYFSAMRQTASRNRPRPTPATPDSAAAPLLGVWASEGLRAILRAAGDGLRAIVVNKGQQPNVERLAFKTHSVEMLARCDAWAEESLRHHRASKKVRVLDSNEGRP